MNKKIKIAIGITILLLIVIASVSLTLIMTGKAVVDFGDEDVSFRKIAEEDTNCIKISEVKKLCKLGEVQVEAGEIKEGDFNVK